MTQVERLYEGSRGQKFMVADSESGGFFMTVGDREINIRSGKRGEILGFSDPVRWCDRSDKYLPCRADHPDAVHELVVLRWDDGSISPISPKYLRSEDYIPEIPGLTWLDQMGEVSQPDWIIDGVASAGNLFPIYGPPKSTKSFLLVHAAWCVATGSSFFGREVSKGGVLIICAERAAVTKRRLRAACIAHGQEPHIAVLEGQFSLHSTPADLERIITAAREVRVREGSIRLIGIDTFAKANAGADDVVDMPKMLKPLARLQAEFPEAVICPIHHTSAADSGKLRGRSDFRGAIDGGLLVEKAENGSLAQLVDSNEAAEPFEVAYQLRDVEIGIDKHGKPFGSAIVIEAEGVGRKAARKLDGQAEAALQALHDALREHGTRRADNPDFPASVPIVALEHWKAHCLRKGLAESDKPDTQNRAFRRQKEVLHKQKLISIQDGFVWLTGHRGHGADNSILSAGEDGNGRADGQDTHLRCVRLSAPSPITQAQPTEWAEF